MITKFFRKLRKSDRGVSIIEFAVILPVLLLLVLGIIEFGWLYTAYITINGAAREGARLAARGEDEGDIYTRVLNHSEFIINADGDVFPPILPAGYPNGISVGGEITVRLEGEIPLLVKLMGGSGSIIPFPSLSDPFPLQAEATMRREY